MKNFTCRMCSFTDFELIWDLKNATYGDLFKDNLEDALKVKFEPIVLVRCNKCWLLQLRDSTYLNDVYDQYLYTTKTTSTLSDYYRVTVNRLINEYNISPNDLIMDIGSNDGSFLSEFKNLGMNVLGVEPAKLVSTLANNLGIKTLNEYFTRDTVKKIVGTYSSPKLISMNYMLANVPNLVSFFENLVLLMDNETVISIITGYHIDQFSINMFDYINHDHSINQLIQREVWGKSKENFGVLELKNRIDSISEETRSILKSFHNLSIHGIGASISTSYLLNYFEVNEYIKELYDDDVNKIGKFSPGTAKKVYKIDDLPNYSKCLAMILAWQHTDLILERLNQVGFKGKIFVPLPYPRFIHSNS